MNLELVNKIADAVLYEGYMLYPYRASAVKNQKRFNFGVLAPHSYSKEQGGGEAWTMRTECLVEGDEPVIEVRVRFLHLVSRDVFKATAFHRKSGEKNEPDFQLVPTLEVGGKVYSTWQEAVEREVVAERIMVRDIATAPRQIEFAFEANEASETLFDADGEVAGKLIRRQRLVRGVTAVSAKSQRNGLNAISIEIQNTTPVELNGSTRDETLLHSLVSTHTILGAHGGRFVSLLDPPSPLAEMAAQCHNVGTWPVLVGEEGKCDMMLSSPIILYDYPQIAPESSGDFFDGTEIDEMLALRVMTLTDEEKREMAGVDDRARQILRRTESLPPEHWQKLHGAMRGLSSRSSVPGPAWDRTASEAPPPDPFDAVPMYGGRASEAVRSQTPPGTELAPECVLLDGVELRTGDRVRIRPKQNADIMDIALKGKTAVIEAIEQDFEEKIHLAVVIDDDPGRDLGLLRQVGHRFFYSLDEVEPLKGNGDRSPSGKI